MTSGNTGIVGIAQLKYCRWLFLLFGLFTFWGARHQAPKEITYGHLILLINTQP